MTDSMPGPASHTFFSQRLRLHYVDWGNPDKPPLLLIHGGRSAVYAARRHTDPRAIWLNRLREAGGPNVAAVALANKNARVAWAMLRYGEDYRPSRAHRQPAPRPARTARPAKNAGLRRAERPPRPSEQSAFFRPPSALTKGERKNA